LVNSTVCIGRNARTAAGDHFGWHASTGPDVNERDGHIFVNNLLTGDENFLRPLLAFSQPASLCERLDKPMVKQLDYNMYVRRLGAASVPLIWWSPVQNDNCQAAFESLEDLRKLHPEFEVNSRYFANYDGPLFKSPELGNYQLLQVFPGSKAASELPPEIRELLGLAQTDQRFIGAYPPIP